MTAGKPLAKDDEMRMGAEEFDRIMGRALQVKPGKERPQQKRRLKPRKKSAVEK
jgi:hypothetical protein